jgi:hypothetical protein
MNKSKQMITNLVTKKENRAFFYVALFAMCLANTFFMYWLTGSVIQPIIKTVVSMSLHF